MSDNNPTPQLDLPGEEGGLTTGRERVGAELKKKPVRGAFLLFGVMAVIVVAYLYVALSKDDDKVLPQSKITSGPTHGVDTTPAEVGTSPAYNALTEQANEDRTKKALEEGGSSVPSMVGAPTVDPSYKEAKPDETPPLPPPPPPVEEVQNRAPPAQDNGAHEAVAAMLELWGGQTQRVVIRTPAQTKLAASVDNGASGTSKAAEKASTTVFHTGDLLIAVTDNEINTDIPSNALRAIVVDGPHKGGVLTGTLRAGKETVELKYSSLKSPVYADTLKVSGLAMDANTARMAIAGDVDKHYLLRYGALFAANFISGFAEAATRANTTVVNSALGGTTTSYGELDARDQVLSGLGKVGSSVSNSMGDLYNLPNTITVPRGTLIGIQMQSDVKVQE